MNAALQGTDPVIFFESQRIYDVGEQFHEGGVPEGYYEIPLGEPDVKREGKDITILTIGATTLYRALDAAKVLEEKYGMSAEVIDARSLVPFNYEKVLESVKKTGRIIIAGDATSRGSFLNDLARNVTELAFDELDAPPVVLPVHATGSRRPTSSNTLSSRRWIASSMPFMRRSFRSRDTCRPATTPMRSKSAALKRAFNRTRPISNQAMNHVRILSIQFQA